MSTDPGQRTDVVEKWTDVNFTQSKNTQMLANKNDLMLVQNILLKFEHIAAVQWLSKDDDLDIFPWHVQYLAE